jgi:hypothetical protein
MKIMYCWRCCTDVPMLDEAEFAVVEALYAQAVITIKATALVQDTGIRAEFIKQQDKPVLDAYRRITGHNHTTHPSDLMHHRIAKYGPICVECEKPLRTPKAKYCAACGADRQTKQETPMSPRSSQ